MRPATSTFRPAALALAGALAWTLAGCQSETKTAEKTPSPPPQTSEVVQQAPAPSPAPAQAAPPPPAAQAPLAPVEPGEPAGESNRRAAELGQSPQTVVIPPEAPPRRNSLAARERRLAARQAELDRRERRLREREAQSETAPAAPAEPAPSPAESEPAAPAPAPEPEPAPPVAVAVPAGTSLNIEFSKTLSSATSRVGETFRARVSNDVYDRDGGVAIPAGAEIVGEVSQAAPAKGGIGGQASLGLHFTDLVLPSGETVPIQATLQQAGPSKAGRDAATIGGATAGGAILGNILSRGSRGRGSVIGALIGAVAGTAIAAHTKGQEVEIAQGTVVGLVLDRGVEVHRRE